MVAQLPPVCGPISAAVSDLLRGNAHNRSMFDLTCMPADPFDTDGQLALFMLHELMYSGWADAIADERSVDVLEARNSLDRWFESSLRRVLDPSPSEDPAGEIRELLDSTASTSAWMAEHGSLPVLAETLVMRSPYQCKEADPHTLAIPRFDGEVKRRLVEIQAGEYGLGHEHTHAELFRAALGSMGLDDTPAALVGRCPGVALATSNLVSMLGSQRRLRGALLGQLSLFEMDSVIPSRTMTQVCESLGAPAEVHRFFEVHVLADVEHEAIVQSVFLETFAREYPDERSALAFGFRSQAFIDRALATHALTAWTSGGSALRIPHPPTSAADRVCAR